MNHSPTETGSTIESALSRSVDLSFGEQTPDHLQEAIRYSLLAPGKRIRPRLSLATAQMLDLPQAIALRAGLAIEMIHCFTLIHDDLPCMDDDDFRRGKPSNHKVYGEALALLAGDSLMAMALEEFSRASEDVKAELFLKGLGTFLEAIGPRGVMGGQAQEMSLKKDSTLDELKAMHSAKTGALFRASILVPKDFAGISPDSEEGQSVQDFAHAIGMLFQVADDLEDEAQDQKLEYPVSILNFVSKETASREAISAMDSAMEKVTECFPGTSQKLCSIAREVIERARIPQR